MRGWGRRARGNVLYLLVLLTGCISSGDEDQERARPDSLTVVDAEGRRVRLPGPARRVVSLVPSATLTLAALGAESTVVARTDHDTASWTAPLATVGGGLLPSIEAIVAARPDLVVRFGGPQDPRTPASLDDLGIPHVAIRPDGVQDILETVRLLGRVTGYNAEATALADRLGAGLDSVRAAAAGLPSLQVAYVLGGDPPWVAGPGTYVHEIMELAGGVNAFSDLESLYGAVSLEEFVSRHIDVILTPRRERLDPRFLGGARIVEVGDALELPGPWVVEAAWKVLHLLHPVPGP